MRNIRIGPGTVKNVCRAAAVVIFLFFPAEYSTVKAEQSATSEQGEAAENYSSTPYLFDLMSSPAGTAPAPPERPSPLQETAASNRSQHFFELFYGQIASNTASVSAHRGGVPASRNVSFGSESTAGLRWVSWVGGDYKNLGFGLEVGYVNQSANEATVHYMPLTLQGMLRVNFFPVDDVPYGRLQLHTGLVSGFLFFYSAI